MFGGLRNFQFRRNRKVNAPEKRCDMGQEADITAKVMANLFFVQVIRQRIRQELVFEIIRVIFAGRRFTGTAVAGHTKRSR